MAELLGVLRPDTDEEPCLYPGSSHPRHQQPEFTEALTLYHQALATAIKKVAPDAALAIGYTYEEQSKKKDAIKWFQRTCKLYPRTRNASKAHAHLVCMPKKIRPSSASPSVAQGKNDPARGVLTFVGLIGNPRLGCNPRSPR